MKILQAFSFFGELQTNFIVFLLLNSDGRVKIGETR